MKKFLLRNIKVFVTIACFAGAAYLLGGPKWFGFAVIIVALAQLL